MQYIIWQRVERLDVVSIAVVVVLVVVDQFYIAGIAQWLERRTRD